MMTNNIKITSIFRFFFWYCSAYRKRRRKGGHFPRIPTRSPCFPVPGSACSAQSLVYRVGPGHISSNPPSGWTQRQGLRDLALLISLNSETPVQNPLLGHGLQRYCGSRALVYEELLLSAPTSLAMRQGPAHRKVPAPPSKEAGAAFSITRNMEPLAPGSLRATSLNLIRNKKPTLQKRNESVYPTDLLQTSPGASSQSAQRQRGVPEAQPGARPLSSSLNTTHR